MDCSKTLIYVAERNRMCGTYDKNCWECPLVKDGCCDIVEELTQKHIDVVQKWSDEHPQETMREHFFKMFPGATETSTGNPTPCPYHLGWDNGCPRINCVECWNRPYEEVK